MLELWSGSNCSNFFFRAQACLYKVCVVDEPPELRTIGKESLANSSVMELGLQRKAIGFPIEEQSSP